jgi:hypothetical protein
MAKNAPLKERPSGRVIDKIVSRISPLINMIVNRLAQVCTLGRFVVAALFSLPGPMGNKESPLVVCSRCPKVGSL